VIVTGVRRGASRSSSRQNPAAARRRGHHSGAHSQRPGPLRPALQASHHRRPARRLSLRQAIGAFDALRKTGSDQRAAVSATTGRPAGSGLSSNRREHPGPSARCCGGRGTSTSNGWRCACCGSGTWRYLSTLREAVRPRCLDVSQVPSASGQWLPAGFQVLRLSCNYCKGDGRAAEHARACQRQAAQPCPMTRSSCRKRSSVPTGPPLTGTFAAARCAVPQREQ